MPLSTMAHVKHYDNLNKIEFDIFRNNNHIGTHVFSFSRSNGLLNVESEINFEIKKFGIVIYKYHVKGTETYKDEQLISFKSKTNQNGKEKYVNLQLADNEFLIEGSSFKGKTPIDYLIGTWWNHGLVKAKAQISAVSGRIIKQKVSFLSKDIINFGDKSYNSLHFNFSSTDESLGKDKKLNTDVWYDEESLIWVKATFKKKGNWEYKLRLVK
jgi:hypothetical protein